MSRKHAGPIMASSFVAGLLVTAAIFLPRVNEPIPEPFFGLDEPEVDTEVREHTTDQTAETGGFLRPARPPLQTRNAADALAADTARIGQSSARRGGSPSATR